MDLNVNLWPAFKMVGLAISPRRSVTVQTVDATPTNLLTYLIPDNTTHHIKIIVVGDTSNHLDRASYEYDLTVYRNGGNATIQGLATILHAQASNVAWSAVPDVSGNNFILTVTGVAATTINWKAYLQIF